MPMTTWSNAVASPTASEPSGPPRALRRLGTGPLLAALLLVVAVLSAVLNLRGGLQSAATIAEDSATIARAENVLSALKDLETGTRGFLLTGEEEYLQPHRIAEERLENLLAASAGTDLPTLRQLVAVKRELAARAIASRREAGLEAAIASMRSGEENRAMDAVRTRVGEIRQERERHMAAAQSREAWRSRLLTTLSLLSALLACGHFAWLALTRRRQEQATAALLEGVLDNAPVGLGFLDHDLRLRQANRF